MSGRQEMSIEIETVFLQLKLQADGTYLAPMLKISLVHVWQLQRSQSPRMKAACLFFTHTSLSRYSISNTSDQRTETQLHCDCWGVRLCALRTPFQVSCNEVLKLASWSIPLLLIDCWRSCPSTQELFNVSATLTKPVKGCHISPPNLSTDFRPRVWLSIILENQLRKKCGEHTSLLVHSYSMYFSERLISMWFRYLHVLCINAQCLVTSYLIC